MKKALLLLFIVSSFATSGQGIEVGIVASPNYSYRTVQSGLNYKPFYEGEKSMFGSEIGLLIVHRLNERLAVGSGVLYSQMGYSYGEINLTDDNRLPKRTFEARQRFDFLNFPVKIQIIVNKNKK